MDCFALLDLPRRAWIEPDLIKERFLQKSAEVHPDKATTAAEKARAEAEFAGVNEAYKTLRTTRSRILHLLELSGAFQPGAGAGQQVQSVPEAALNLFPVVAEITREADQLLREKSSVTSPMLKAAFFSKALDCAERVQRIQSSLRSKAEEIEKEVRALDSALETSNEPLPTGVAAALTGSAAALGFLERWQAQLQERAMALSF
jgi:DnaJ-domain-containing protein 1